jgi:hypothetical protein
LIEDECGLGNWGQDVTSFVPAQFEVSAADETGFNLDSQMRCVVDEDYQISCDSQTFQENVGFGCTFTITNQFLGQLEATNDIAVDFNIVIEGDGGLGCGAINLALTNGGFPCDVILYANAQPN